MQYIYTMIGVSKIVPPKREIIKDISLSFFPGAKIGCSASTARANRPCCASWPAWTPTLTAKRGRSRASRSAICRRNRSSIRTRRCAKRSRKASAKSSTRRAKLDEIYAAYAEEGADFDKLAAEQQRLEAILAASDAHTLERTLEIAADALRLPPWDAKIGNLSGGEKRRVALCRLLLSKPDMLLLDEPTNHLDAESVEWLEQFLASFPGTVVAVTHDRYFLDNAAEWILELDRGRGIPWKGNYSSWLEQKDERLKQEESARRRGRRRSSANSNGCARMPKAASRKGKARLNAHSRN